MLCERITEKYKKYKSEAFVISFFSLLLYSFFMTQQLTNNIDGFWQQSYYLAGDWEVSCGRWLWPYIDKLQFGIHIDPLTTISALAMFIIGYILILDLFNMENHRIGILGGLIFISSPVILVFLSYRYMAVTFATSFLFSVLAAYFLVKIDSREVSILLSMLFTCLSMSLYQAHLAVVCILGLFFIIYLCINNSNYERIIEVFVKLAFSIVGGGLLYYLSLNIYLKITGLNLGDYNGASSISILSILKNFPGRIFEAYKSYFNFFANGWFKYNVFEGKVFITTFVIFFGVISIIILVHMFKKDICNAVIVFLCLLLVPLAATATLLLTEEVILQPQMCCSLIMSIIVLLIVGQNVLDKNKKVMGIFLQGKFVIGTVTLLLTFLIYGNSIQNLLDQNAMYEGKNASVAMLTQVVDDLEEAGAISDGHELFFVGKPYKNKYFKVSPLFEQANDYAQVGNFPTHGNGMYAFYQALFNKLLNMDATVLCVNYEDMAYEEYYQAMPCYPEQGYFVVWDTVIVKISEP